MTRRSFAWGGLAVLVVGMLVWASWPSSGPASVRERATQLASELRCPDCEGLSVADSSTTSGRAIRADLRRRMAAGQSDEAIRQVYVDRYGDAILLKPEGGGLGILVWGLPAAALVLGVGGLALAFSRWRRQPRMHATPADVALVQTVREEPRDGE